VARRIARGEIWLHRFAAPDKRRPVLVVGRDDVISWMQTVLVAPITSTIRGLPSEVSLGVEHGMKGPCVANLDQIRPVRQADLRRWVSSVGPETMSQVCHALGIATGCT
jgi:mRNA interferase MazF